MARERVHTLFRLFGSLYLLKVAFDAFLSAALLVNEPEWRRRRNTQAPAQQDVSSDPRLASSGRLTALR
jgi:hypothetical protein